MKKSKKLATINDNCVSCGACVKKCPFNALSIFKGIKAKVDSSLCIGCGICTKTCPANSIDIIILEAENE